MHRRARPLHDAALPISVVEAGRVGAFAGAQGRQAKTDPLDARVLADYCRARPPATPPTTTWQERLAALDPRHRQLLEPLFTERNRKSHYIKALVVRLARARRLETSRA